MRRAAQTAEIIAPCVGDGSFTAAADCSFCERHHGEADGLTWDEYDLRYGAFDALAERQRADAPGEECYEEVVRRVEKGLDQIVSPSQPGSVVVVAHGGVVGAALELLVGTPLGTVTRYVDFTSITEFEWDDHAGRWWLSRLNDAGHLEWLGDSSQQP
jgi:probable phosphoglycerate mutase